MLPASLLAKKRDAQRLTDQEIQFIIAGFCSGQVTDYQMSALAMAICIQGMDPTEIAALTNAMVDSGTRLPRVTDRPRVDKHSTGGLGDKVSLILAPLLAECGVDVPMISGRGLGLTGGTLDKLEAIEGFETSLSIQRSNQVLRDAGAFIIGADESIAPADRRLYALRDVTGTVESIALITASILSKKIAASLDSLVMDIKVGSGAFMTTLEQAQQLTESIIQIGAQAKLPVTAILSDMDQPLGQAIGNAIEVNEAVEVLRGGGPDEVRQLTIELCADLLVAVARFESRSEAIKRLQSTLSSGAAYERFEQMVAAQGGEPTFPLKLEPKSVLLATESGWVSKIDSQSIGHAVVEMGGGRKRTDDTINPAVGIRLHHRVGEKVSSGDPILTLHHAKEHESDYLNRLRSAVQISPTPVRPHELVLARRSLPN